MIDLRNQNLASIKESGEEMLKVGGSNLISKELEDVQKILKANDEYLKMNEYVNQPKKYPTEYPPAEPEVFNLDSDEEHQKNRTGERPWHEIVHNYQQQEVITIKTVERN
jgi:hypothetical protein